MMDIFYCGVVAYYIFTLFIAVQLTIFKYHWYITVSISSMYIGSLICLKLGWHSSRLNCLDDDKTGLTILICYGEISVFTSRTNIL
jgi:hypothetical protein